MGPQGFEPWTDGLKERTSPILGIVGRGWPCGHFGTRRTYPVHASAPSMHRLPRRGARGRGGARSVGSARTRIDGHQRLAARGSSVARDSPPGSRGARAPGVTRDDRPDPMGPLIDDLVAEQHALDAARAGVPDAHWERPSPAAGWVLRDGIAHLAEGDARGTRRRRDAPAPLPLPQGVPLAAVPSPVGRSTPARARAERVDWWRTDRDRVRRALRTCAARDRLPWAGRRMRARSFATSRLAACWSPGLEALEAAGQPPIVTDRIRHLAPLGDITRACADRNRGRPPPVEPLRVGARCAVRGVRDLGTGGPADPDRRLARCLRPRGPAAGGIPATPTGSRGARRRRSSCPGRRRSRGRRDRAGPRLPEAEAGKTVPPRPAPGPHIRSTLGSAVGARGGPPCPARRQQTGSRAAGAWRAG